MTTPILSKGQQRKSLSAKKGPVKGLKNVLAQPPDNYWPLLKNDNGAALENILKRLLPVLKRSETKIPWSQLRKMKTEERSAARRAAQVENNVDYDETIAKSIVFGVNAVTRLIEKNEASCILLDANVDPTLLVKHIVNMGRSKEVPTVLISFLKKVTLETVGFASAAIALKKHVQNTSEDHFNTLFEKISELAAEMPSLRTPVSLFQNDSLMDDEADDNKLSVKNEEENIKNVPKPSKVSTNVYLYRKSKKERIFEPSNTDKSKQESGSAWGDFIALDDNEFVVDEKKMPSRFFGSVNSETDNHKTKKVIDKSGKSAVQYKPLKVKRLQGNESRSKATKPPKVKKKGCK